MTIASFNARLRRCDPYLHIRKRTGWVLLKSEGFSMAGVFHGQRYVGLSTICGDMLYHTRPTLYRVERLPGYKKPLKYIHSRMRRGRYELIRLLQGHRAIKHRYAMQFLKI